MSQLSEPRLAGILLHISSLPGSGQCGDMGKDAYQFIRFLRDTGIRVWQTLPLGMTHGDGSPYQCLSAHAGNPELINIDWLVAQGWLAADEYSHWRKTDAVRKAYDGFCRQANPQQQAEFSQFCADKAGWLNDFALFIALRNEFDQLSWNQWPVHFKQRDAKSLQEAQRRLTPVLNAIQFEQYVFFKQWHELKQYAVDNGVLLFGDIPIFVSYDSADVWANREVFKLTADGSMETVAGVPPDYFSELGQRWGNPHYNWEYLQQTGFAWWLERIKSQYEMFDILRIDHFRGLEAAWEIPASEETAINGKWVQAPGYALLAAINKHFDSLLLVAEDLGIITPEVEALRDDFSLPGMKILQFAFDGDPNNLYLPMNCSKNCVIYTGTHDNDTTLGWFNNLTDDEKRRVYDYLGNSSQPMPWALIFAALMSVAKLAVIPMQDVLELGSEARMNTPGTITGNWHWRFNWWQLTEQHIGKLRHWINLSGRHR